MKKNLLIKFIALISIIIPILLISILVYIYWGTSNNLQKKISLKAPNGTVVIQMDNFGIPHISSTTSDLDVYFALGFIHAKDRFWQMEFQKRVATGTLSEVFGEITIPQDKFLRTWGFYRAASDDWAELDEKTKAIINNYTAGVNEYLKNNILPLQFILLQYAPKKWNNIDSLAWGKVIAWQLQNSWQDKIENYCLQEVYGLSKISVLKPPYPPNAPTTLSKNDLIQSQLINTIIKELNNNETPKISNISLFNLSHILKKVKQVTNIHQVSGKGSNNWVISGQFTKSGKPLLANDIHLELSAPTMWYLAELKGPNLHVIGASIPGVPTILAGRNDYIAWGITNAGLDAQDIYLIPKSEKTNIINEVINVKNSNTIHYKVEISSVGPIINDIIKINNLKERIAIKWTALIPGDTTVQSFLKINYARNWKQFTNALKDFIAPSLNFVYADKKNNIGYYLPGLIPIRDGWSGKFPIPLDTKHKWNGFIPFEHLPHVFNPPEGIIISANNKVVPDDYPYNLTYHWIEMPHRAYRLSELLSSRDSFDVEDMAKIQNDIKSYLWNDIKSIVLLTKPLDSASQKALDILKKWDGNLAVESIGATVFSFWFQEIKKLQPTPSVELLNLTNTLFILSQLGSDGEFCKTNKTMNCNQYLSLALKDAMHKLVAKLGNNEKKWQWGKIHTSNFKLLGLGEVNWLSWIWNRTISTPGDSYTVNVGAYDNSFNQVAGATYRQIIDLNCLENSRYIQAFGQSDNPLNTHYNDQMKMWSNGEYINMKGTE